jgi:hypothetical protein
MSSSSATPPIHYATEETINRSKKFMDSMNKMVSMIFDLAGRIPDGEYLDMMNTSKELYGFKPDEPVSRTIFMEHVRQNVTSIFDNPVIQENQRIATYVPKKYNIDKTDAEKLKAGYKVCCNCDKLISPGYLSTHQKNNSCKRVVETKKLSLTTSRLVTTNEKKIIMYLRAWKNRKDTRRIVMYKAAIDYFHTTDPEYTKELQEKLENFAKLV